MDPTFRTDEVAISQLPAMLLLAKMGWQPLTKEHANSARQDRDDAVILEDFTRDFLRSQSVRWGETTVPLSEDNIENLISRLKQLPPDTFGKQAEGKWDLLCLPQAVEQVINGTRRSLNARFINFDDLDQNMFHMVPEFEVGRTNSTKTRRPDIVLFVNGIPLVVIENKKAATDILEGVSQTIRNQKQDNIPQLYVYAQILLSVNKNDNRYGTTGTPAKLWNTWRENEITDGDIHGLIDASLDKDTRLKIFADDFAASEDYMEKAGEDRLITQQDKALVGLCRPDRLLRITREFILFDGPGKVIARFQQFDAVRKTLKRLEISENHDISHRGGVIWHTQGSGKSLTMVMLARALITQNALKNARIVLVNDRVDLDKQIKGTFMNTGMEPKRATTGRELSTMIKDGQAGVITTVINKFDTVAREKVKDHSSNIFLLVDEGHRSQYGRHSAQMRRVFPNAAFIAFTGTPIAKKDRNTMTQFGPLIDTYTMRDAIRDGAVVPLIYEGRLVEPEMDAVALDTWFDRLTSGLSEEQKRDLKNKYAKKNMLSSLDKVISCRAFDISEHFRANYQGTGLKAQIVAPNKLAAVKYKRELDEIGHVSSEVLISSPDTREGHESVEESKPADEVVAFWGEMMNRWGDEEKYNDGLISQFKNSDGLEIIIVVSKLLTGFDAPRNSVLYLTRSLKEHSLLQAIARVNRVLDTEGDGYSTDKDYGYIVDYEGILKDLGDAFSSYDALAGFDEDDLQDVLRSLSEDLKKLPQNHSELLDIFSSLEGSADEEAYEVFLKDQRRRDEFYECLTVFAKSLGVAFGSAEFFETTSEDNINRYKHDLMRFINLRTAVKRRYAEAVDFRDYERKIEKVLNNHIGANNIKELVPPINIFNMDLLNENLKQFTSDRARADYISHSMKRTITEKMGENPNLYEKLSEKIDQVISKFIEGRYAEVEYLSRMKQIHKDMINEGASIVPKELEEDAHAAAFHGYLTSSPLVEAGATDEDLIAFSKRVSAIFKDNMIVDLFLRPNALNQICREIDDYLYDELKDTKRLDLSSSQMDDIQHNLMQIAELRMSR